MPQKAERKVILKKRKDIEAAQEERRQSERFDIALIRVKISMTEDGSMHDLELANLGRGGMFIKSESFIPEPGQKLAFYLKLPLDHFLLVQGLGEVRWARAESSDSKLPKGFAVQFKELQEDAQFNLDRMISQLKFSE